ncbi:MAG TPA: ABC-2 transporter permease [Candidatus Egerieimonas intestinavium]|uniref:ABC-2 transporter permease n=1 Tax=Candidatus Egerieimonas intestinavium TaxID=2840777 RepID=A0A9D1EJ85_9FIRM|nr:ABC-2 transporter permease [Candidatus Egerieimonas intestinavium]
MRGMLRKDFYLMKEYRRIIVIVAIMSVTFCFTMEEGAAAFVIGYSTLLMAMAVTTVIAYDQENKGMAFLFTLPINRTGYVREKYLFGLLVGGFGLVYSIVLTAAVDFLQGRNPLRPDFLWLIPAFLGFLGLSLAVMIPIQLKFGEQKGRVVLIVAVMVLMLLVTGGASFLIDSGILTEEILSRLLASGLLPAVGAVVVLMAYGISYGISIHILNKKEF